MNAGKPHATLNTDGDSQKTAGHQGQPTPRGSGEYLGPEHFSGFPGKGCFAFHLHKEAAFQKKAAESGANLLGSFVKWQLTGLPSLGLRQEVPTRMLSESWHCQAHREHEVQKGTFN